MPLLPLLSVVDSNADIFYFNNLQAPVIPSSADFLKHAVVDVCASKAGDCVSRSSCCRLIASYCVLLLCVIRPHTGTISMYSATDMAVVTQRVL